MTERRYVPAPVRTETQKAVYSDEYSALDWERVVKSAHLHHVAGVFIRCRMLLRYSFKGLDTTQCPRWPFLRRQPARASSFRSFFGEPALPARW